MPNDEMVSILVDLMQLATVLCFKSYDDENHRVALLGCRKGLRFRYNELKGERYFK